MSEITAADVSMYDLAQLAADSYSYHSGSFLPDEWVPIKQYANADFFARAYRNIMNGAIVIAFRGSDGIQDWVTDNLEILFNFYPDQMVDALTFVADVMEDNVGADITLTGHSLGGGIAQLVAAYYMHLQDNSVVLPTITFNAPGVYDSLTAYLAVMQLGGQAVDATVYAADDVKYENITNLGSDNDIVKYLGNFYSLGTHIGELFTTVPQSNINNAHSMDNYIYYFRNNQNYMLSSYINPRDEDATDLTLGDTINPSSYDLQNGYGHIDASDDVDQCTLSVTHSGYYRMSLNGSIAVSDVWARILDESGNEVRTDYNIFVDSFYLSGSHKYTIEIGAADGCPVGARYRVTVAALPGLSTGFDGDATGMDADAEDLSAADTINLNTIATAYGHTEYDGDEDFGILSIASSGYYDISSTGHTAAGIYDKTEGVWLHGTKWKGESSYGNDSVGG